MSKDKNFVGNGWIKKFDNGGEVINISLDIDKIKKLPVKNGKYVSIVVAKRKSVPQKPTDFTHTVYENTYQNKGQDKPDQTNEIDVEAINVEMPF